MRWKFLTVFSLFVFFSIGCAEDPPVARSGPRFITDAEGRALVLRGTNLDNHAKHDPLHTPDLPDEEIEVMAREMGLNFVRYLVFWSGLEPEPGRYDEDYLDRIEADLDRLHGAGIWVLLDMHQDVYSARFCCDGAPEWAIRDDGLAFEEQEAWFANYLQPAVQRAFDNFWAYDAGEHADLQDHYIATLRHLAARFRAHPAVLGYDVMNEPHAGSDFDLLDALSPLAVSERSRRFDETKLHPFYQRAIDAIREVDGEGFIFFEPRYGGPANGGYSYIPPLADPRAGESRLVLAPHLYSVALEASGIYRETDRTFELWEERRGAELERQGMPLVLGEWGLGYGATDAERFVTDLAEMATRMLLSWAHWSWDPGGPTSWALYDRETGAPTPMFRAVERPYPRATAGEPVSLSYEVATETMRYEWRERAGVRGETEIFFPPARGGASGHVVELSSAGEGTGYVWDEVTPGLLRVTIEPGRAASHVLTIRPAE